MKLSIIIPYLNDLVALRKIMPALLQGVPPGEAEIIIIDNGSEQELVELDDRVRVVRNQINIGVGGAFNQGVVLSKADRLVLMGCDVIPQEGWYDRVMETLDGGPGTIFNCASSGFYDDKEPFHQSRNIRKGADLLYTVSKDDLPEKSPLRDDPAFSKILQAKWRYSYSKKELHNVECLLGAFYWMHKSDYELIRGWNGHKMWGSLEPFLSIKARAHGIKLIVDTKLEGAHYYGRSIGRPFRMDLQYYNMLFMAETMFSDALRDGLVEHLRYGGRDEKIEKLNVNKGLLMIMQHHGLIQRERQYNNHHFKHGLIQNWGWFQNEMK